MKALVLLAILAGAVSAQSQSLKEALYGGKLKLDTGTVIRKGDDLSTRIDTSKKAPVVAAEPVKSAPIPVWKDSAGTLVPVRNQAPTETNSISNTVSNPAADNTAGTNTAPKDNTKTWKDFIDELTNTLRSEVLTSKKLKEGTYSVLIEYEIDVDGQVAISNVTSSPGNSFLEQQVKDRLVLGAPNLNPVMAANGKPRKVARRQMITLTK
jgi:hypothetical protein